MSSIFGTFSINWLNYFENTNWSDHFNKTDFFCSQININRVYSKLSQVGNVANKVYAAKGKINSAKTKSSCVKPQEASHPQHNLSKHNLSRRWGIHHPDLTGGGGGGLLHPDLARGVIQSWPGQGVPRPDLAGGVPQSWPGGTPSWPDQAGGGGVLYPGLARGVPHPDLARVYPSSGQGGVLHPDLAGGYPPPPRKGPATSNWGTPQKEHGTNGSIMGWRWGTPPPICE